MYEFTETMLVAAPPTRAWEVISDLEGWWPTANPDHESVRLLGASDIRVGAQISLRERIAGMPGESVGIVTVVEVGSRMIWEAPEARYRWHGMPITVSEGVTWAIEPGDGGVGTRLSTRVWVRFPVGILGSVIRWAFVRPLKGIEKDREHVQTELRHLKRLIEAGPDLASEWSSGRRGSAARRPEPNTRRTTPR